MKKHLRFLVVILFLAIPSLGYGFISTQGNISMSNYNITLIPILNLTSMSSDGRTLTINVNSSTLTLNSSSDFTLSNITYINDNFNFTVRAGSGILNITVKMTIPNAPYNLRVDGSIIASPITNQSGFIYFNYSSWSQHDFSIQSLPTSVSSLTGSPLSSTEISWGWINPVDSGFDHVELYFNGRFITNTVNTNYLATSLTPDTQYTLSLRTVDTYGNVNSTWFNSTIGTQILTPHSGGGLIGSGSTSGSSSRDNNIPVEIGQPINQRTQSYSETIFLSGDSARIPIISSISTSPPIKFLNLFFTTAYSGEYTIGTTTYTTYSPALEGAREYFSISPQLSISSDSNMEITSSTPIEVFQLTSAGWIELRGIQRLADGSYGVPISSLGIFAIKESGEAVMQAQQAMYVQPTDKSIKQQIQDVVSKVRAFVQSPPTLQEIRAGIREAISNVRLQAQKLGQNLRREIGLLSALKRT